MGHQAETVVVDVMPRGGQQPIEKSLNKRLENHDACTSDGSIDFCTRPVHGCRHLDVESNSSYVLSDDVKFFRLFSMGTRRWMEILVRTRLREH